MNRPLVSPTGLAQSEWIVREVVAVTRYMDEAWDAIDSAQSREDTLALIEEYTQACDYLDLIEQLPDCAYGAHRVERYGQNGAGARWRCTDMKLPHNLPF